jgi:3-vinyl bacteriochlorophyllide hydratase
MLVAGIGSPGQQLAVALAGYATYVVNAAQFVWKLRLARLDPGPGQEAAA